MGAESGPPGPPPLPNPAEIGPDVDRGAQLAAAYIVGCGVSFLFVVLRFWARMSIHQVASDDWWMLATFIAFLALTIIVPFIAFNGGTRHLAYLMQDQETALYVSKLNWIAQPFGIFALGTGKIAIALLIVRLLDRASKWRKWFLHLTSVWTLIDMSLMILFTFVQCKDPRALWDPAIKATTKCWDPRVQSYFAIYGSGHYALTDFILALMPITLVYKLKLDLKKKIGLCVLLGLGTLTGISGAIKTSNLVSLQSRSDITWETFELFIWTGIEIVFLIVCGSIPALKPLYKKATGKSSGWTKKGSNGSHVASRKYGLSRNSYAKYNGSVVEYPLAAKASPPAKKDNDLTYFDDGSREEQAVGGVQVTRTFSATWEARRSEKNLNMK